MSPELPSNADTPAEDPRPLLSRVLSVPEGKILLVGLGTLGAFLAFMVVVRLRDGDLSHRLATMTTAHLFGGRAAGLTTGINVDLPRWSVLAVSIVIETFLVTLFFPLFVLSYSRIIVIKPLEDTMTRARRAAAAHRGTIMKYGIPGLLLFVWFPFLMTGPLVGSVIGFLIGLRPWTNVAVVLAGTYLAIVSWWAVLDRVSAQVEKLGPYAPLILLGVILFAAVAIHVRYALGPRSREPEGE